MIWCDASGAHSLKKASRTLTLFRAFGLKKGLRGETWRGAFGFFCLPAPGFYKGLEDSMRGFVGFRAVPHGWDEASTWALWVLGFFSLPPPDCRQAGMVRVFSGRWAVQTI